jgi:hypothetical protein
MTAVYGPCFDHGKSAFLAELHDLRHVRSGPRLLCGDFNLLYRAEDKNNGWVNRRLMGQFRSFINATALKELHLNGRLYTWNNERAHPTLERIDRAFVANEWEELFPANELHSLPSHCLDHAPLVLQTDASFAGKGRFHFRAFWPKCQGFLEVVEQAWYCPLRDTNPFHRLDWLLRNTSQFLKSWSDRFVGNVHLQLQIAREVVARLEVAGDLRPLAEHEDSLRQRLMLKMFALSSVQRTIAHQESRVLWLKGDAPTKFFHMHANARHR